MSSRSATVRESSVRDGSAAASSRAAARSSPAITRLTNVPPCGGIVVMSPLTAHLSLLTLYGERVQAALGLARAAPPPRALRFAGGRRAGARPTPDARVALIEQRGVWDGGFPGVAPHGRPTPVRQRKHFRDRPAIDFVILDDLRGRATGGLILPHRADPRVEADHGADRKSTRLNSSHGYISYAVFCLKKKQKRSSWKHSTPCTLK